MNCKVCPGGGSRAAYQVGVLKTLVELLPLEERSYDVVTGIK
jgi:predicted acylesterase/phospholipase RssA